ncbi:MAG: C40 family peptidase [Trebonia sp.]
MRKGMVAGRTANGRWGARLAGLVALVAAALLVTPGVASARPYNPTDGQISAAQQAASAAAAQVGAVSAQLATAQDAVDRAAGEANIALDHFQAKQQEYETAQAAAKVADDAAQKAQADLDAARVALGSFARDSYMSGSTSSRMTALLSSGSPSQMLERAALLDAAGDNRSKVVDQVTVAQHVAAVAADAAHTALAQADSLKKQAQTALASAEAQEASARQQAAAFQTQQAQLQVQLTAAQQNLASLQGQRATAAAYDRQQAAAAAARSSGSASYTAPTAGPGSSAARTAINAALRWVGTMYAWGGGSLTGPSEGWGIDAGVVGFDCSGLTRYAYAQAGITIPRNSTAQYAALPSVSRTNLQPGDLVFYAFDTSDPGTIHHVAMYLGNGQMIEAPESGERVHVTSMRWGGYIGAVRPSA